MTNTVGGGYTSHSVTKRSITSRDVLFCSYFLAYYHYQPDLSNGIKFLLFVVRFHIRSVFVAVKVETVSYGIFVVQKHRTEAHLLSAIGQVV